MCATLTVAVCVTLCVCGLSGHDAVCVPISQVTTWPTGHTAVKAHTRVAWLVTRCDWGLEDSCCPKELFEGDL